MTKPTPAASTARAPAAPAFAPAASAAPPPMSATADVSALRLTLRAWEPLLSDPEVTEVCINRPQEA